MSPILNATRHVLEDKRLMLEGVEDSSEGPTSKDHLLWMIDQCLNQEMSEDKASRWLGFIQGVMCARGWLDMEVERAATRTLFHEDYREMGWDVPASVGRTGLGKSSLGSGQ